MIRVVFELTSDRQKQLVEEFEPNPFRPMDLHELWCERCAEIMPLITVICLQCGDTLRVDYPEGDRKKAILKNQICECEDSDLEAFCSDEEDGWEEEGWE